jgi:amidase
MKSLIKLSAARVVGLLRRGEVTPLELLDALEARIAEVDGTVNALPTLCFERARAAARQLMRKRPEKHGRLAGLPVAIKDLMDVAGVRTTSGSTVFRDRVAERSDILVERLEANGAVVYAKSNTPEFGAGANTFNEVFGRTLNPWNTALSAGGSSGGAAAALATGMAWLAHGSDMAGSLRTPASFCGVVGFRPSPGRVAATPGFRIDDTISVEGPMARSVKDVALFLDAMTGAHPTDPISFDSESDGFEAGLSRANRPKRIAFSSDLGVTPVDPEVAAITRRAALRFRELGVEVEEAHPDLGDAHDCFGVIRARNFAISYRHLLAGHRADIKPEVVWNVEQGLKITADDIIRAERQRSGMFRNAVEFLGRYDLLLAPAAIVPPYPVAERYVESCGGKTFANYYEWLAIAYAITLLALPVVAIPCGFTRSGLPVGLQIVGPPRGEARVLRAGAMLETLFDRPALPIDPRPGAAT